MKYMSYDITLTDPVTGEDIVLENKHFMFGGTYAVNGTNKAWMNITYNYSKWYYMDGVFPKEGCRFSGIRSIYGMSGAESIPVLKNAIQTLEEYDGDITEAEQAECRDAGATGYWMPIKENAIKPLYQLLAFAQMRPDGIWDGD